MVCYRRRGHNEGDDPSMTQPLMYNLIEAKRSVRKLYTEALIGRGDISQEDAEAALRDYQQQLERVFLETKEAIKAPPTAASAAADNRSRGLEKPASQAADYAAAPRWKNNTGITAETLQHIGDAFANIPDGFTVHPKLRQLLERRAAMTRDGRHRLGAWASCSRSGRCSSRARRSGSPARTAGAARSCSGTRSSSTRAPPPSGRRCSTSARTRAGSGSSTRLLSEFAAMGFEYGYSVERPDALVLWEAQFGDFANGAQTIIDEFISSSEQKWGQRSSVTLLLPHGYEGQGPDHSSARIERYLQLCAEDNMTVAYPSTPASYFHLLRRQAYARPRRPLIVFTPKSMLRLKAAASSVEDFTQGGFRPVLPDPARLDPAGVTRVILASGKVVYDLEAERTKREDTTTAIVRVERLAPVPGAEIAEALAVYPGAEVLWVQDEPRNQGAWPYMALNLPEAMEEFGETRPLRLVSRMASASPATGSHKKHEVEQENLVAAAFDR